MADWLLRSFVADERETKEVTEVCVFVCLEGTGAGYILLLLRKRVFIESAVKTEMC